jgi:hypothetical protein
LHILYNGSSFLCDGLKTALNGSPINGQPTTPPTGPTKTNPFSTTQWEYLKNSCKFSCTECSLQLVWFDTMPMSKFFEVEFTMLLKCM